MESRYRKIGITTEASPVTVSVEKSFLPENSKKAAKLCKEISPRGTLCPEHAFSRRFDKILPKWSIPFIFLEIAKIDSNNCI